MPKYGAHAFLWIDEWTTEKGNQAIHAAADAGFTAPSTQLSHGGLAFLRTYSERFNL